ncbi:MAG: hypothetical protein ACXW2U_07215 [Telluria sp.]
MTRMTGHHQERGYNAGETAFMLRLALGPWRDWRDALTDMRIGKTSIVGHTLQPTGHTLARGRRPIYTHSAIVEFIEAIRLSCPEAQRSTPPKATMVILDVGDTRNWHDRILAVSHAGSARRPC